MRVISVTYEKPSEVTAQRYGASWEFSVETDTEFPHGYKGFGGVLRRVHVGEGVQWQAAHYSNTDWAAPSPARQTAIANLLPSAFAAMAKWQAEEQAADALRAARRNQAAILRNLLTAHRTGLDIGVHVNDFELDEPVRYNVTLTNLNEQQVRELARDLETV